MKTTKRFDNAVIKLYNAYHENRLNANQCTACAVGNICDNNESWKKLVMHHGKREFDFSQYIGNTKKVIDKTGYSPEELLHIETIFLKKVGYPRYEKETKEGQFLGLCAVIEYLCELDNIKNVMDYTKLFETEENAPKYTLETLLS